VAETNSGTEISGKPNQAQPGRDQWVVLEERLWKGGFLAVLILIAFAIFRSGGRYQFPPPGWDWGAPIRFQQFGPMPPPPPWAFGPWGPGGFAPYAFGGRAPWENYGPGAPPPMPPK
jgi:hypothetical protein